MRFCEAGQGFYSYRTGTCIGSRLLVVSDNTETHFFYKLLLCHIPSWNSNPHPTTRITPLFTKTTKVNHFLMRESSTCERVSQSPPRHGILATHAGLPARHRPSWMPPVLGIHYSSLPWSKYCKGPYAHRPPSKGFISGGTSLIFRRTGSGTLLSPA